MKPLNVAEIHTTLQEVLTALQSNRSSLTPEQAAQIISDVDRCKAILGLGVGLTIDNGNVLTELREINNSLKTLSARVEANTKKIAELQAAQTKSREEVLQEADIQRLLEGQKRRYTALEKAVVGIIASGVMGALAMGFLAYLKTV